jgi:hypothetical protein
MIWIKEFFKVMNMFIIMHATVTYYNWEGNNEKERVADLDEAYKVVFGKHFGSVAVGAPILAFVRLFKVIIGCINEGFGNSFANANAHLSEEVFAYIAVFGHNFCSSASENCVLQNKYQN